MTAKLEKTLKREVLIDGQPYTVSIDPDGIKLTQKGFRKGQELTWRAILGSSQNSESGQSSQTAGGDSAGVPSAVSGARENSLAPYGDASATDRAEHH